MIDRARNLRAVALAGATLVGVAVLAAPPTDAYSGPTKVVTYNAASMRAAGKRVKGFCWISSMASGRSDAFRCTAGNFIIDPCFAVSSKVVNCPLDMTANAGTIINLTKPLPEGNPPSRRSWPPWSLRVAEGIGFTCFKASDVAPTDYGNYEYYCSGGDVVCTVPEASARIPRAYLVTCGTRALRGSVRTVKGARTLFVATMWE
jgi:hypothetical protein